MSSSGGSSVTFLNRKILFRLTTGILSAALAPVQFHLKASTPNFFHPLDLRQFGPFFFFLARALCLVKLRRKETRGAAAAASLSYVSHFWLCASEGGKGRIFGIPGVPFDDRVTWFEHFGRKLGEKQVRSFMNLTIL